MANGADELVARALRGIRPIVNRTGFDLVKVGFRHRFVPALLAHGIDSALDVGANVGQFGKALREAGFGGRIVSLEPLREAYARLARTAAEDALWLTERVAVSDVPGTVTLNVAGNSVSSSVLPMARRHAEAAPQSQYVATEDVAATTVDDLVEKYGLAPERSLLKIDVQGYEQAVLAGAKRTLGEFGAVRMELSLVELYEGQALLPEMLQAMLEQGLALWTIERGFSDPRTGRLLQVDGVFIRSGR